MNSTFKEALEAYQKTKNLTNSQKELVEFIVAYPNMKHQLKLSKHQKDASETVEALKEIFQTPLSTFQQFPDPENISERIFLFHSPHILDQSPFFPALKYNQYYACKRGDAFLFQIYKTSICVVKSNLIPAFTDFPYISFKNSSYHPSSHEQIVRQFISVLPSFQNKTIRKVKNGFFLDDTFLFFNLIDYTFDKYFNFVFTTDNKYRCPRNNSIRTVPKQPKSTISQEEAYQILINLFKEF